ncbi:MAG: hypothetical protein WBA10_16590, partial [Elainellaceae cyanobacterium]
MEPLEAAIYAEEVDFQKYWLVLKRRWLPAVGVFGVVAAVAVAMGLNRESLYQATGKVQLRTDRTPSLTGLDENSGRVDVLTFQAEPLETQAVIVESAPVLQRVIEVLDLRDDNGELQEPGALGGVDAQPIPGTEILKISYQSEDPELAVDVVNQVMEAYRSLNVESNREEATAARRFIEEQLPATEAEVLVLESRLKEFKEANKVVSLEEEAQEAVEVLSNLSQDQTRAEG